MKGLVYTALFGGRDVPMPVTPEPDVDFLMFSDSVAPSGWQTLGRDPSSDDPRLKARLIKTNMPNQGFADGYDWTMWIDASHVPRVPVAPLAERWLCDGHVFAAYQHHAWNCTYVEIKHCIRLGKDKAEVLAPIGEFFKEEKFPQDYGQIATTILLRRQCDIVKRHALRWHTDMTLMSVRDQVSFMYELWKLGFKDPYQVLKIVGPHAFENKQFHYAGGH